MRSVTLMRPPDASDFWTFGWVVTDRGLQLRSGELPYRDANHDGITDADFSCIPLGEYETRWVYSPTRKEWTYRLLNVPGRDGVLIHPANFTGAVDKGLIAQVKGCIALGQDIRPIEIPLQWRTPDGPKWQPGLLNSKDAVAAFIAHMEHAPFMLKVQRAPFTV